MEDRGPCLFTPKLTELQLFQVEKHVPNEGQNQSEQSLLTVKPMAPISLDSISRNTSLILMNKEQLLTAPGGPLIARISLINPLQDSGSLLKIALFVHAYRAPNLKARQHTTGNAA